MPRLYREAPVNSIWEGAGNVAALDVLRALATAPATLEAFFTEVARAEGADRRLDAATEALRKELAGALDIGSLEHRARALAERMALVLQGSLLVRHGDPAVADAFCASRLGGEWGGAFGTLGAIDADAIVARARIAL